MDNQEEHGRSPLRDGDPFYCSRCGSRSIARLKREYDGFRVRRSYLCCAFCDAEIAPGAAGGRESRGDALDSLFAAPEGGSRGASRKGAAALDELFGEAGAAAAPSLDETLPSPVRPERANDPLGGGRPYRFCRDCVHHFENPFRVHCVLHDRDVEPMGDCPDFAPLTPGRQDDP